MSRERRVIDYGTKPQRRPVHPLLIVTGAYFMAAWLVGALLMLFTRSGLSVAEWLLMVLFMPIGLPYAIALSLASRLDGYQDSGWGLWPLAMLPVAWSGCYFLLRKLTLVRRAS